MTQQLVETPVLSCRWAGLVTVMQHDKITVTNGTAVWLSKDVLPNSDLVALRHALLAPASRQRVVACIDDGDDMEEAELAGHTLQLAGCKVISIAQQKHMSSDAGDMWIDVFRYSLQLADAGCLDKAVLQPLLHEAAAARAREQRMATQLAHVQQQLHAAQQKLLGQLPSLQLKLGLASLVEHLRQHAPGIPAEAAAAPAPTPAVAQAYHDGASTASDHSSQSSDDEESCSGVASPIGAASSQAGAPEAATQGSMPVSGTVPLSTLELVGSQEAPSIPVTKKVSLLSLVGAAAGDDAPSALRSAPKRRRRR